jgi:hypothetical protein
VFSVCFVWILYASERDYRSPGFNLAGKSGGAFGNRRPLPANSPLNNFSKRNVIGTIHQVTNLRIQILGINIYSTGPDK